MAEPFKNLLNPSLVDVLAGHLAKSAKAKGHPLDAKAFAARGKKGLEALEMKARAEHLAEALVAFLPDSFDDAATILEGTLAPAFTTDELAFSAGPKGVAGWIVWPLTIYVSRKGIDNPKRALAALREMTMRFTAEWAIRPFVTHHPKVTFATLAKWARDPNVHVRRLVSEGTRPRLPWGTRLDGLVADPTPTFPLLEALRDDESEYVRRSVANHLNDVAKDHPATFAEILERWMKGATPERRRLLSHASRTLVKAGDPRVLRVFGLDRSLEGKATFRLGKKAIALGDGVPMELALVSSSDAPQKLVIDYVVHHVRANGGLSPKTFKGWSLVLGPRESRSLSRTHPVRPITTRRYYEGRHEIECRVNGVSVGRGAFELELPREKKR